MLDPMVIATKGIWTWDVDPMAKSTQGYIQQFVLIIRVGSEIISRTSGILRALNLRSNV